MSNEPFVQNLTEQEKTNLKNDGKFTEQDIALFTRRHLAYDLIKALQSALQNSPANAGKPLEEINRLVIDTIEFAAHNAMYDLNQYLSDITSNINRRDADSEETGGGKRRKKGRKTNRRKGKGRKTKGRRTRRYKK